MKTLNAPDTISGKEGRAYAKINGNNEELFYAKTIEANVEKSKSEIKAIGKRMTGHKTTGANGSGSMTRNASPVEGNRKGRLLRYGGRE